MSPDKILYQGLGFTWHDQSTQMARLLLVPSTQCDMIQGLLLQQHLSMLLQYSFEEYADEFMRRGRKAAKGSP